jgi:hypothetical protein
VKPICNEEWMMMMVMAVMAVFMSFIVFSLIFSANSEKNAIFLQYNQRALQQ